MTPLVHAFEAGTGHEVSLSYASTGKHHAQITNGAPFDLFLAADEQSPQRLEDAGLIVPGSRFTYAVGKLVMWARTDGHDQSAEEILKTGDFRFLAIANPVTAPYGRAAAQYLRGLQLWDGLQGRIVRGENVAQVFAFVSTGNAQFGLMALSQVNAQTNDQDGQIWLIPESHHDPIIQQAVLMTDHPAAAAFARYLRSAEAQAIITRHGYSVP